MTKLLRHAVEMAGKLPDEIQDEIARTMLAMAEWESSDDVVYVLSDIEKASLTESLAQAERGEFISDDEVAAIWAKYGL